MSPDRDPPVAAADHRIAFLALERRGELRHVRRRGDRAEIRRRVRVRRASTFSDSGRYGNAAAERSALAGTEEDVACGDTQVRLVDEEALHAQAIELHGFGDHRLVGAGR
jgi:hypothetical protein